MGTAKIDAKGIINNPKDVREKLGIKGDASMTLDRGALVITPSKDPYEVMKDVILKPVDDVPANVRRLKRKAEEAALKAVKQRWR